MRERERGLEAPRWLLPPRPLQVWGSEDGRVAWVPRPVSACQPRDLSAYLRSASERVGVTQGGGGGKYSEGARSCPDTRPHPSLRPALSQGSSHGFRNVLPWAANFLSTCQPGLTVPQTRTPRCSRSKQGADSAGPRPAGQRHLRTWTCTDGGRDPGVGVMSPPGDSDVQQTLKTSAFEVPDCAR